MVFAYLVFENCELPLRSVKFQNAVHNNVTYTHIHAHVRAHITYHTS